MPTAYEGCVSGNRERPCLVSTVSARLEGFLCESSPGDRTIFLIAAIAALTARMKMAAQVQLLSAGKRLQLEVETNSPFSELTAQVRRVINEGRVEIADDVDCDAALEMDGESNSSAQHVPRFGVRIHDNAWIISLTCSGSQPLQRTNSQLAALVCLIKDAAERPEKPVGRLRLIRDEIARALYAKLNRTATMVAPATVLDLLASTALSHASKEAVVFAQRAISYEQLRTRSNALAKLLRNCGADQKQPVAICLERSDDFPLIQLAALKAGSFYVPLDPGHPQQRLLDIVAECRPAIVIVSQTTSALFTGSAVRECTLGNLESEPASDIELPPVVASDLAYMIYTSGTTGRPKGVMVTHGSLVNLLLGTGNLVRETNRLLAVASFAFDISGLDMFLPLIHGATVVIAPESATGDPWHLMELMEQHDIDFLQATPVTWRMLITAGFKGRPGMKMLSGGEALARDLADALLRTGCELWNGYGPTETTIYSSMLRVQEGTGPVTIGPPMANTRFYVVDEAGQLLPPEIPGELYIGGHGVADGYFERPELNATRFLPDTWALLQQSGDAFQYGSFKQPRVFRTGDLVRWLPESENAFEIFGRLDHQVKLRGYRIELGEIETILRSDGGISDAAVLLREDEPGEPRLVGYCAQKEGAIVEPATLLAAAAKRLPRYMLPSRLIMVPALPLTGSGKVDRRALAAWPAPEDEGYSANTASTTEPMDGIDATLLRIFREVLKSKTFGLDDDYFLHGGYSMQAIRLFAMINQTLQRRLPLTALFDAPTVRRLAALIRSGDALEALVPVRAVGVKAPFFLVQSYLLYDLSRDLVESDRPVYGLREGSTSNYSARLQDQVTLYVTAINKQYPEGVVHLGGWCAAAPLTVEIARTLKAQGRMIGMVALFDADAPGFVERPPNGNVLLARLGAMWRFHNARLREMRWHERYGYVLERALQAPANAIDRFYERHSMQIVKLQRRFPILPAVVFRNQFHVADGIQLEQVQPLDLRVHLFRARDVPIIPGTDEALGWHAIARGGVEVKFIPGHHESMFLAPNITVLREALQASMWNAESQFPADRSSSGTGSRQ